MNTPVYPKENPEYRKLRMELFYKSVRETRWDLDEEVTPKYRLPKINKKHLAKPRTKSEAKWVNCV